MFKVAIVGSERKYWTEKTMATALKEIMNIFSKYPENMILISGHCPKGGVDIWAEDIAKVWEIPRQIYVPDIQQWESTFADFGDDPNHSSFRRLKGYKERNIEIAEACDVLYCIDPIDRKWSGGRWTLEHAKELGKETHLVQVE